MNKVFGAPRKGAPSGRGKAAPTRRGTGTHGTLDLMLSLTIAPHD
jgi:hypothetical protein